MRKSFFHTLLLLGCMFALSSCDDDDPDYHVVGVTSTTVTTSPVMYYADQQSDSLKITTTDSWTADTDCDWITFRQTGSSTHSGTAEYSYGNVYTFTEAITILPNTTGETRYTTVKVSANDRTIGLYLTQADYLNITNPAKSATGLLSSDGDFVKSVEGSDTETPIGFYLYATATLQTSTSWITVPGDTYGLGSNTATLTLQSNTTGSERTGTVTVVSSSGPTTNITIKQAAQ